MCVCVCVCVWGGGVKNNGGSSDGVMNLGGMVYIQCIYIFALQHLKKTTEIIRTALLKKGTNIFQ